MVLTGLKKKIVDSKNDVTKTTVRVENQWTKENAEVSSRDTKFVLISFLSKVFPVLFQ